MQTGLIVGIGRAARAVLPGSTGRALAFDGEGAAVPAIDCTAIHARHIARRAMPWHLDAW